MKTINFAICILAMLSLITSCNRQNPLESNLTQSNVDSETVSTTTPYYHFNEIEAECNHYRLVSHGLNSTTYYIFDAKGNMVWKKHNEYASVRISEKDNVVVVSEKSGYALSERTMYYSVEKDLFSSTYSGVAAYENGIVVYTKNNGSGIVIESVFDSLVYSFLERDLDFTEGEPIKSVCFQDNTVVVEYKCFDDGNSISVTEEVDLTDSGSQGDTEPYPDNAVAEGDYYRIVSHGGKRTTYYILDANGITAAKKYNDLMSVTISEQDNVVIIREGLGNGPTETMYYNVKKDLFCSTYYDVAAYEDGIVVYPKTDGSGIVIESIFDSSVYQTIDCRLDMSFRKAIQNAYFENGSAVVEYKCFINEDSDKTVVKKEIVPLYPSVK